MAWRVEVLTSVSAPRARSITTPKSPVPCRAGAAGVVAVLVVLAVLAQPAANRPAPAVSESKARRCNVDMGRDSLFL